MTDIVDRLRHIADLWEPDEKSSIQLEAAAEITRLRAALAARTEECARVAEGEVFRDPFADSEYGYNAACTSIAAAIRVLPSPPVHDTIKQEGG